MLYLQVSASARIHLALTTVLYLWTSSLLTFQGPLVEKRPDPGEDALVLLELKTGRPDDLWAPSLKFDPKLSELPLFSAELRATSSFLIGIH